MKNVVNRARSRDSGRPRIIQIDIWGEMAGSYVERRWLSGNGRHSSSVIVVEGMTVVAVGCGSHSGSSEEVDYCLIVAFLVIHC
jgi:hypothetical protein